MALTDDNGFNVSMPVAPMGGGNYGGGWGYPMGYPVVPMLGGYGGYGNGFGGDWSWVLILFLFAAMGGGWGGLGGWGGGLGNEITFPWLLNGQQGINSNTNAGFNQAATASALGNLSNAVTGGFGDLQLSAAGINQNICQSTGLLQNAMSNGFAGATAAVTGAQNGIAQQLYNNEINSLERSFAEQTANTAAINGVQSKLADCCCENRLATQALQAVVQQENCADREALSNGVRDIIANQTAGTQRILDKLCDQELAAERRENDQLRQQLNMANLAASQTAQTAQLLADNARQTQQIENYVRPQINPAYIVPNPYAAYPNFNNGCGCGSGIGGFNGTF